MSTAQPDLSMMSNDDLCSLMLATGMSNDPTDREFCKACRDEITKRKPQPRQPAVMRARFGDDKLGGDSKSYRVLIAKADGDAVGGKSGGAA